MTDKLLQKLFEKGQDLSKKNTWWVIGQTICLS